MITLPGTYTAAKVYTDDIESSAEGRPRPICNFKSSDRFYTKKR